MAAAAVVRPKRRARVREGMGEGTKAQRGALASTPTWSPMSAKMALASGTMP